jgi:hypothetical protein
MSTPEQSGKPGEMGENPYAGLASEPKVDGLVVERDTQGISANTEAIPTSTEKIRPEPVFEKGQTVWIKRSSGKIQEATVGSDNGDVVMTHWEEDGKVYDRTTSQAELAEIQKTMGFEKDQTVWIKRSSGDIQQAQVSSVDGDTVMTHWTEDGKVFHRPNDIAELRSLQKTVAAVDSAANQPVVNAFESGRDAAGRAIDVTPGPKYDEPQLRETPISPGVFEGRSKLPTVVRGAQEPLGANAKIEVKPAGKSLRQRLFGGNK